ncbi:MAG: urease accessory protein UreF [Chloroflexota bacterium]|nr:urease accessory protein UreF [Chloroflexota bacterium]
MLDESGRGLLTALQLADSFFPTGAYAHSQGLEGMVAQGWVSCAEEVHEFLAGLLAGSLLPSDGVALLHAHRCAGEGDLTTLVQIDRRLNAMRLPEEIRLASTQSGRRFLDESFNLLAVKGVPSAFDEYRASVTRGEAPGCASVAFALSAWAAGVEAELALFACSHSFAVGVLGAAQRLMPLSHSEAQQILRLLHRDIGAGYREIQARHWKEMTSFAPLADIASMRHEAADVRMFAS